MRKHSALAALVALVLSSGGCAATSSAVSARLPAPAADPASRLVVENQTNANLHIYAVSAGTRTRVRLGEARSLRRTSFTLPPIVLSESEEFYLLAVPANLLRELGVSTASPQPALSEVVPARPGQRIVWRLTGIDTPRVSSVAVF